MQAVTITQISAPELESIIENSIYRVLAKQTKNDSHFDEFLSVKETASFLKLSVQTIYGLISRNAIPSMKRSKRVYFSKTELENYLKEGKKKSSEELIKETDLFILNKKGGRNGK